MKAKKQKKNSYLIFGDIWGGQQKKHSSKQIAGHPDFHIF